MLMLKKPCDGCGESYCDYRHCKPYRRWFCDTWEVYQRYSRYQNWKRSLYTARSFTYIHPDHYRRYLQEGPCPACSCEAGCTVACDLYWRWWDQRMAWLRWKLRNQSQEVAT